jgi:hypothetical protein
MHSLFIFLKIPFSKNRRKLLTAFTPFWLLLVLSPLINASIGRDQSLRNSITTKLPSYFIISRWMLLDFIFICRFCFLKIFFLIKIKVTSSGTPFWSGPKRAPTIINFDAENVNVFLFHRFF